MVLLLVVLCEHCNEFDPICCDLVTNFVTLKDKLWVISSAVWNPHSLYAFSVGFDRLCVKVL